MKKDKKQLLTETLTVKVNKFDRASLEAMANISQRPLGQFLRLKLTEIIRSGNVK